MISAMSFELGSWTEKIVSIPRRGIANYRITTGEWYFYTCEQHFEPIKLPIAYYLDPFKYFQGFNKLESMFLDVV